jgi:hypothetical protein
MPLSYRSFFLPITLIFTLGVSNCKTANQAPKKNPELSVIKNVPNVLAKTMPPIAVAKNNPARPELKRIFPKLSTLQNLTANQVHALLGSPNFKRSDNPAEVWQYRNNNCTLDLFLYENLDTNVHSVVHYEIRLPPGQVLTKNECFEIMIKAPAQSS